MYSIRPTATTTITTHQNHEWKENASLIVNQPQHINIYIGLYV